MIVTFAPEGRHIALQCANHPDKRWSTKNIAPIGCRTIFYCGTINEQGICDSSIPECDCVGCLEACPEGTKHPWSSQ